MEWLPRSLPDGLLAYVVLWEATELSCMKSRDPEPDMVKEEVWSWAWVGRENMTVQVLPAYEAGMSKLKIEVMSELAAPKYDVPAAVFGDFLLTGIIR